MKRWVLVSSFLALSCSAWAQTNEQLAEELRKAETAFAKTMSDRDYPAFQSLLADDAVFFSRRGMRRGKQSVAEEWKRWYEGKDPSFSWGPETVVVLDSGTLGFSSGPVFDPTGKRIATFNSVWRREKDGKWRIVFDKGCPYCEAPAR